MIASFSLGVYLSDYIKGKRAALNYTVEEGFYPKPYSLRIANKEIDGKVQSYLVDTETKEAHKIGEKMYVGDTKHRLNSVIEIPKEYLEKTKTVTMPLQILELIKP